MRWRSSCRRGKKKGKRDLSQWHLRQRERLDKRGEQQSGDGEAAVGIERHEHKSYLPALRCFAAQCSSSRPRDWDELGQEFGWERTIFTEFPDVDAGNPPAGAIVEKFEAVHGTAFDRAVRGGTVF